MAALAAYIVGTIVLIIAATISLSLRYWWARCQLMKKQARAQAQRNSRGREDTISVEMSLVEPPPPYTGPLEPWSLGAPPQYTLEDTESVQLPLFINVSCPPPPLYTERQEVTSQEAINPSSFILHVAHL